MYRGALWDVELREGAAPESGEFEIVEVREAQQEEIDHGHVHGEGGAQH